MKWANFPWDIAALFLGIGLLVGYVGQFHNGFHNVDLVTNFCFHGEDVNSMVDWVDVNRTVSLKDLYIIGSIQMQNAFYGSIIGTFLMAAGGLIVIGKRR